MHIFLRIFLVFAIVIATSCVNVSDTIDSSWLPEKFFKNAQEAMDISRYADALYYYEVFLVRYPENYSKQIAAKYERAFIHYKIGKIKEAEAEFKAIIEEYQSNPYAMLYPPRFKQLAQIGLKNIYRNKKVNGHLFWRMQEKSLAKEEGRDLTDKTVIEE